MNTNSISVIKNLFALILAFVILYYGKDFLMPLVIGGILATLFLPLSKWLESKKIKRALAGFICLLILVLILTFIFTVIGYEISELINDFDVIKEKGIQAINHIQEYIFDHIGISVQKQSQIIKGEQPSISAILQKIGGSLSYVFTNFIFVLAYLFFLLLYRSHIRSFILKLTPSAQQAEMANIVNKAAHVSQQYLVGLFKMIVCLWVMYSIGFSLLGVKNAIFFAILCGLLEIVPYVGNITGTSLTVFVSWINGASPAMLGGIVATYGSVQFIQGWLLEPLILGPQVKINPLFTIISLVVGELVWGISGIFLAIPIIAMIKIVCDNIESLKPYGFLIGEVAHANEKSLLIKKVKTFYKK